MHFYIIVRDISLLKLRFGFGNNSKVTELFPRRANPRVFRKLIDYGKLPTYKNWNLLITNFRDKSTKSLIKVAATQLRWTHQAELRKHNVS